MKNNHLKIVYLFNASRLDLLLGVKNQEDHDGPFVGLFRLGKFNIDARFAEIELIFPKVICRYIRKYLPIYFVHLPIFWKIWIGDIIFSSSAFGLQMLHALCPFIKSKWVMLDFSITGFLKKNQTWRTRIFYWLVSRSSGIITISRGEREALKNIFPRLKIEFIPYGVDTEFFKPQSVIESHQILSVGRDPGRDYRTLFSACQTFDIKVVVTHSRKLAGFSNLPDFVRIGTFSAKELVEEYAKSKIFILPLDLTATGGVNEAMGCSTLIEAMAMGRAIIATRTPTTESYISHGKNGFLVEAGNVGELQFYLRQLLADDGLRAKLGQRAREFAVTECSADVFASRLAQFFQNL